MASAQAAAAVSAATVREGADGALRSGPVVPDDPGLNPAAPAELLPLELPRGASAADGWWGQHVPQASAVPTVAYGYDRSAFEQRFSELSFRTLLTQPEVIGALVKLQAECAKVEGMCGVET
jgi:hypothetical protein